MDEADLRPERVASEIGVSRDTLDRYTSGTTKISALDVLTIAQLTGKPFGWFAGADEIPIPEELDRAVVGRLLDALEERSRATDAAVAELRALLQGG